MSTPRSLPFNPAHWPFFYGWMVLGLGTFGMLMSIPGQTVGVSVFTDLLIRSLHVSRTALSLAYLIGTVSSALLLSFAGRTYDRFGARPVAAVAAFGLAAILLVLSFSDRIASALGTALPFIGTAAAGFIVMAPSFFFLRFFGQGVLTLCSSNMVMKWFESRRGFANAILGISTSFGFSYAPRVFEAMIAHGGWQHAWRIMAVVVGAFAVVILLMYRDSPEAHGLLPDGGSVRRGRGAHPETAVAHQATLKEARSTYSFWIFALTLLLAALLTTASTFNIVSLFAGAGMSRDAAVSIFFPASIVAVALQFIGSWASDYIRLKFLLMIQILGIIVMSAAIIVLRPGASFVLLIVGQGMIQGMFGIIQSITWPRFFGRAHLGAIAGFVSALAVAGSAVGPYLFSLAKSSTGSYAPAALVCLVGGVLLFGGSFAANRPVQEPDTEPS